MFGKAEEHTGDGMNFLPFQEILFNRAAFLKYKTYKSNRFLFLW